MAEAPQGPRRLTAPIQGGGGGGGFISPYGWEHGAPVGGLPPWTCHDGQDRWYRIVHPDLVEVDPGAPLDEAPPLARCILISDSAGNPLDPPAMTDAMRARLKAADAPKLRVVEDELIALQERRWDGGDQ